MADIATYKIQFKSDFVLTIHGDAGWTTPFCIKFWTGAPSQAYFVGWDGKEYINCKVDETDASKLIVLFDDHQLPVGQLKMQMAWHTTIADFPHARFDEVMNQMDVVATVEGEDKHVELAFEGEADPEVEYFLPAYANEAQRIANEEQRIAHEAIRIVNEESRIAAETIRQQNEAHRISNEESRVAEFARLKQESETATADANAAATLANEKAALAADKAALAGAAATLANAKAQLAADKAALAASAAQLANDKAALAQQKAEYARQQGDYAKAQGDTALADHRRAESDHATAADDHTRAESDHGIAADDHTQAGNDHTRAESDHSTAASDHTRAGNDHTTAQSDHGIAADDHTQAGNDHTRAESDHGIAADDHTQAGNDHTRAESDHTRSEQDHTDVQNAIEAADLVYDISKANAVGGVLATYADLSAALGVDGANVPVNRRQGGMTVKFVLTSDNKYVQYRYMPDDATTVATFTNVANWQGVDEEPVADSKNLITSGAVYDLQEQVEDNTEEIEKKANKDGYYETLGAGTASNLRGQNTIEQRISYRPSGGNLDVATGAAFIDSIKGKTVKFNQKVVNGDFSNGTTGWNMNPHVWIKYQVKNNYLVCLYTEGVYNHYYTQNVNIIAGHKYFISADLYDYINGGNDVVRIRVGGNSGPSILDCYNGHNKAIATSDKDYNIIYVRGQNNWGGARNNGYYAISNIVIIDLTEIFGEGNEPSTAAEFEQWCEDNLGDSEYFDHNDGNLLPVKLDNLKTVGFNQYSPSNPVIRRIKNQQYQITGAYTDVWESWFSENAEFMAFVYGNEIEPLDFYYVNSRRYMSFKPVVNYDSSYKYEPRTFCIYNNQVYKCTIEIGTAEEWNADHWTLVPDFAAMVNEGIFTMVSITPDANGIFTPTERYIHVEGGNATDTCVHLVHSGERNGEYEPYKESTKALPITTMQGRLNGTGELVTIFPDGLKSAGTVYDEIKVENGVVKAIKRVGSVDLGTLNYYYFDRHGDGTDTEFRVFDIWTNFGIKFATKNFVCYGYPYVNNIDSNVIYPAMGTFINGSGILIIRDNNYTNAATFKTAMSGVMLYYELATPLEYVVDGFEMPAQYLVDDWGTEMTIPQNDGEAVTALATLGIRYDVNAVDQLRRIPQTTITSESMDNFLIALGAQMGGTWTKTWNSETNKYAFTFTANPLPEEEVEPENN